jgi:hypothetical protein
LKNARSKPSGGSFKPRDTLQQAVRSRPKQQQYGSKHTTGYRRASSDSETTDLHNSFAEDRAVKRRRVETKPPVRAQTIHRTKTPEVIDLAEDESDKGLSTISPESRFMSIAGRGDPRSGQDKSSGSLNSSRAKNLLTNEEYTNLQAKMKPSRTFRGPKPHSDGLTLGRPSVDMYSLPQSSPRMQGEEDELSIVARQPRTTFKASPRKHLNEKDAVQDDDDIEVVPPPSSTGPAATSHQHNRLKQARTSFAPSVESLNEEKKPNARRRIRNQLKPEIDDSIDELSPEYGTRARQARDPHLGMASIQTSTDAHPRRKADSFESSHGDDDMVLIHVPEDTPRSGDIPRTKFTDSSPKRSGMALPMKSRKQLETLRVVGIRTHTMERAFEAAEFALAYHPEDKVFELISSNSKDSGSLTEVPWTNRTLALSKIRLLQRCSDGGALLAVHGPRETNGVLFTWLIVFGSAEENQKFQTLVRNNMLGVGEKAPMR